MSERRVLYAEKSVYNRWIKTLALFWIFFGAICLVFELSVSITCDNSLCKIKRSTIFTDRVTESFGKNDIVAVTCQDRFQDSCRLKIILGEEHRPVEFFNFQNGSEAYEASVMMSSLMDESFNQQGYHQVHHGNAIGRHAEHLDMPTRFGYLLVASVLSIIIISVIVPYKREWVVENGGVLMGIDHYLHFTQVWNGSFWTLNKYVPSIAFKEVTRRNLTYAIYWLELSSGSVKSQLGDVVRFDSELEPYLAALQQEISGNKQKKS